MKEPVVKIKRFPKPSIRWILELIWVFSAHRVSVRYKETLFGFAWILLQPVALTFIFYYIFHRLAKISSGEIPYPLFVGTAQVVWSFTTVAINQSIISFSMHRTILRRIYFPRILLPLSVVLSAIADFCILVLLLGGLLFYYQSPLHPTLLWTPMVFATHLALLCGLACLGAIAVVLVRDLGHAIPSLMQIWFFASPVFYPFSMVPEEFKSLSRWNPMTGLIESYRSVLLLGEAPPWDLFMPACVVSFVILTAGLVAMHKLESIVVDII